MVTGTSRSSNYRRQNFATTFAARKTISSSCSVCRCADIVRRFFDRRALAVGTGSSRRRGIRVRLEHLSGRTPPLWNSRVAAQPRKVVLPSGRTILEFPLAAWEFLGRNWPVAGGGYHRLLPGFAIRSLARRVLARALMCIIAILMNSIRPSFARSSWRFPGGCASIKNLAGGGSPGVSKASFANSAAVRSPN